jgi:hypothetical protein
MLDAATAASACVWTSGNPEIAAPIVEGRLVAAPPLPPPPIGWSARIASTPEAELASLRAAADVHRLASPALRQAESTACAGLSDDDVDVSPFFYGDDIVDAQALRAPGGAYPGRLEGAVVKFRRVEGLRAVALLARR